MSKSPSLITISLGSTALLLTAFILSNSQNLEERQEAEKLGENILENWSPQNYQTLIETDHTAKRGESIYHISFNEVSLKETGQVCATYTVEVNSEELLSYDGPKDYQDEKDFRVCINNTPT